MNPDFLDSFAPIDAEIVTTDWPLPPVKPWEHQWSHCDMCGPMVVCGKCGNNTCNAGRGTLPDGTECDRCKSAYEKYQSEYMNDWRRRAWAWRETAIHYYFIARHWAQSLFARLLEWVRGLRG